MNNNDDPLQVFALSTAFEEFSLNTVSATTALVQKDQIFGATRNALGKDKYGRDINFRVATDKVMVNTRTGDITTTLPPSPLPALHHVM